MEPRLLNSYLIVLHVRYKRYQSDAAVKRAQYLMHWLMHVRLAHLDPPAS